jgi:hypothetical protein
MLDAASAEDGILKDGRREIVCILAKWYVYSHKHQMMKRGKRHSFFFGRRKKFKDIFFLLLLKNNNKICKSGSYNLHAVTLL